jgi:hypothetical protein
MAGELDAFLKSIGATGSAGQGSTSPTASDEPLVWLGSFTPDKYRSQFRTMVSPRVAERTGEKPETVKRIDPVPLSEAAMLPDTWSEEKFK